MATETWTENAHHEHLTKRNNIFSIKTH